MRWLNNAWLAGLGVTISGFALLWRSNLRRLTGFQISARQDLNIAEGARPYFDQFRLLGFHHVASADAGFADFETIFAYLVSADRRTYVVVTDKLQCLASRFGYRVMVTMDRASFPTGPLQLRQVVRTSDLTELANAHRSALGVLASHGHQPDRLEDGRIFEFSLGIDRSAVEFLIAHPWLTLGQYLWGTISRRPPDSRRIADDPETNARIERWAASRKALD